MIDIYLTDEVEILTITYDDFGKQTRTTTTEEARVEAQNKIIAGRDGQETQSDYVIVLKETTSLREHSKLKIKKLNGEAFYQANKEFLPLKILRLNNYIDTHVEVTV